MENQLSDKPKTSAEVLANIGYSKGITETPSIVTESKGFQMALEETGLKEALIAQGIDSKKIAEKVDVLLNAKNGDKDDYGAIDKGLKHATAIYGVLQEKPKDNSGNTYNFIFNSQVKEKVREMEDEIKDMLTKLDD